VLQPERVRPTMFLQGEPYPARRSSVQPPGSGRCGPSGLHFTRDEQGAVAPTVGLITAPGHEIILGEEEMADVSLATFYVFGQGEHGNAPGFGTGSPWLRRLRQRLRWLPRLRGLPRRSDSAAIVSPLRGGKPWHLRLMSVIGVNSDVTRTCQFVSV
jgi:hypothetical protein